MDLEKKAVKGVLWSFVEKWGGQLISTTVFLLLARLLGPEAFGLVALASVFIAFTSAFVDQGFASAIVQREVLDPGHLDTAFWISIAIGTLLALANFFAAGFVSVWFKEPDIEPILRWFSLVFILIAFQSVQVAILRRNFAFKNLAYRSLVANVISGLVGVVLAFKGAGVWSLVAQQLSNRIVNVSMLWGISSWRPGINVSYKHFTDLFGFGINVTGINVLKFFNQRSDDFLIGYFLGPIPLGYYSVAYRLLTIMVNIFANTTTSVALPAFSRLQQEPERLRNAFYKVTQLTSFIAFPAFSGVIALAPELVRVMFGADWETSIPVMQVLAMAGILQSVTYFNGTVMMAKGKPNWRLGLNCLNAVLNVAGFMIAVRYGIIAIAIAFVSMNYLLLPLHIITMKKLIDIRSDSYFKQLAGPVASSIIMVAILVILKSLIGSFLGDRAILVVCILTGIMTYAISIYMTDRKLSTQIVNMARRLA